MTEATDGEAEGAAEGGGRAPEARERAAPRLEGFQKRALRARAHGLRPVAIVGDGGLHPALVASVDRALLDHELVKVRLRAPTDKKAEARELAETTGAALCGLVGHTVILFRPHPENPVLRPPDRPASGDA